MKQLATVFILLFPFYLFSQTIVSTTPSKKNVVLEEFTGINCGYCPQGHKIAQAIQDANPGRVVIINIHTGSYANPGAGQPDFRTQWGTALMNQSGLTGFPSGTINRHVFPGMGMSSGSTAMGRENWENAASQILSENSYLNIGAQASINYQTRLLSVYVEVYYTSNGNISTNKLNVALVQNNTIAPQANGGNSYNHMHRLIHLLTSQWGADITSTAQGTLYTNTFTYSIPEDINNIPILLDDLELGIFVAEGQQEIITGIKVEPTLINPEYQNDLGIENIFDIEKTLIPSIIPQVKVKNMGNDVTGFTLNYSINNGDVRNYTWEGDLKFGRSVTIQLPEIDFILTPTNTLTIELPQSDEVNSNNKMNKTFNKSPVTTNESVYMRLETDKYGDEVSWSIKNSQGDVVQSGGPYSQSVQIIERNFILPKNDYTVEITDAYGDGLYDGSTTGRLTFWTDDTELFLVVGNYGKSAKGYFRITSPAQITIKPENGQDETLPDKPIRVESNKRLFLSNWDLVTNTNVNQLITFKKGNFEGQDVTFIPTIDDEGKIINVTPNPQLEFSSIYYLTLNGSAIDEDGLTPVCTPLTFTTIGNNPPEVTFPVSNNQTDVFIDMTFYIHFNQPVVLSDGSEITNDNVSTTAFFRKGSQTGENTAASMSISFDKKIITVNPMSNLDPQQVYYLGVGSNIKGMYNNPVTEQGVTFTTGTNLNISREQISILNVYPNPSEGQFRIYVPGSINKDVQIDIYNSAGKLIRSISSVKSDREIDVDIRGFSPGTYIARISTRDGFAGRSILILK